MGSAMAVSSALHWGSQTHLIWGTLWEGGRTWLMVPLLSDPLPVGLGGALPLPVGLRGHCEGCYLLITPWWASCSLEGWEATSMQNSNQTVLLMQPNDFSLGIQTCTVCITDPRTVGNFPWYLCLAPSQSLLSFHYSQIPPLSTDLLTMWNYSCLHLKTYPQSHLHIREEGLWTSQHPAPAQVGGVSAHPPPWLLCRDGRKRNEGPSLPIFPSSIPPRLLGPHPGLTSDNGKPTKQGGHFYETVFCRSKWPPRVDLEGFRGA